MKIFGKRGAPQPRLSHSTEPHRDTAAVGDFAVVLATGRPLIHPRLRPFRKDSEAEFESAVNRAQRHCNRELLRLMLAYRKAVLACKYGTTSLEKRTEADRAGEAFITGCRIALGTND